MYLCFEIDDKRAVFPESSVINFDENGFTVRSLIGARKGTDLAFVNMHSFRGVMPNMEQALKWVKRSSKKAGASSGKPASGQAAKADGQKLPETPSF